MSALSDSSSYEDPTAYEVRLRKYSREIAEHTLRQWNATRERQEKLAADTTDLEDKMASAKISDGRGSPQRRSRRGTDAAAHILLLFAPSSIPQGQQTRESGNGSRAAYAANSEQQRPSNQSTQSARKIRRFVNTHRIPSASQHRAF
ncbi:hypothetical protein BD626DRAFT_571908 [Schizophyllum amplum]|uniref:Uncharacterized protein n=1 Tax=Schizophyllum amplum TaxID=97359 RepID=A0A550C5R2_9AGAR|nr:hypothetical protein BD626DRAFT_571908 [Auriculariopsis ampla]